MIHCENSKYICATLTFEPQPTHGLGESNLCFQHVYLCVFCFVFLHFPIVNFNHKISLVFFHNDIVSRSNGAVKNDVVMLAEQHLCYDLLLLYFFSNSVECTDYLYKQIEPTNTFPDIRDFLGLRSLLGLRLKQNILCIHLRIVAEQDKQVSISTVVIYLADYMYMAAWAICRFVYLRLEQLRIYQTSWLPCIVRQNYKGLGNNSEL